MGFKADEDFLRFLTMGAAGARCTIAAMQVDGLEPIELERYCTSNKIWATKVKRLRLPDLLCVRTGVRVEVRAKSKLFIRMSDAPANPDRRWDSGMRDDDLVNFIACREANDRSMVPGPSNVFTYRDLRASVATTTLGPPKSARDGAERDRSWPTCVPKQNGVVLAVERDKIRTQTTASGRQQPYRLGNGAPKVAYVVAGDAFVGEGTIIAATVRRKVTFSAFAGKKWDPFGDLTSSEAIDRYAAAKALGYRHAAATKATAALKKAHNTEAETRVKLEIAGALARLEPAFGVPLLEAVALGPGAADMRMEAVLILTEIGGKPASDALLDVANKTAKGDEIRQAAVWGLGVAGAHQYRALLPFIADEDTDLALHAISSFGRDTPAGVVTDLVAALTGPAPRARASASEALRTIGGPTVLGELVKVARAKPSPWVLATLGRLPADLVRPALAGTPLLATVEPLLTVRSEGDNWLATDRALEALQYLSQQVPR